MKAGRREGRGRDIDGIRGCWDVLSVHGMSLRVGDLRDERDGYREQVSYSNVIRRYQTMISHDLQVFFPSRHRNVGDGTIPCVRWYGLTVSRPVRKR